MKTPTTCLRCESPLQEGFIEDQGGTSLRGRWIPGPIETGILGGTKVFGKTRYDIVALRCTSCGHLELIVPV
jgi:hypothetical protein